MLAKKTAVWAKIQTFAGSFGKYGWIWVACFAASAFAHFATAFLRLSSFFPFPQAVDFSSYYAGAWSIRLGISPYPWSDTLLEFLSAQQALASAPPIHNSSPLWAWLLQPMTAFAFPAASMVWLGALLAMTFASHVILARIAGCRDWKLMVALFPLTLSFGPLFLNLTLGQSGVLLLFAALMLGMSLAPKMRARKIFAIACWIAAVAAKIYPALWVLVFAVLRRWRAFAACVILCGLSFGLFAAARPELNKAYWLDFLPSQTREFSSGAGIDDQSINGFLTRMGASGSYAFPGLSLEESHQVNWSWPWNFSAQAIRYVSFFLMAALGALVFAAGVKGGAAGADGFLYSLILFSLLLFPHMERYNHILALPAMAWMWTQKTGGRKLAVGAHALFALSRLNHLWARFPAPFGPIASGFGLFGVLALIIGISLVLLKNNKTPILSTPREKNITA